MGQTCAAARGQWRRILPQLGVPRRFLDGRHGPCPLCGGKDRFRFDDRSGDGDYYCNGCGAGKGFKLLMKFTGWSFREAANRVDIVLGMLPAAEPFRERGMDTAAMLRRLWRDSAMCRAGDPVCRYLVRRGLGDIRVPGSLRYVPRMWHRQSTSYHPGMLALFSDAQGKPSNLQRTFLTGDGHKANVDPVRMCMPGAFVHGGAVRLGPEAERMGIAEGVETALAASRIHNLTVWAALSTSLLVSWQSPSLAREVIIFGDNDENFAGQFAAHQLARRLKSRKIDVRVMIPDRVGCDWNDVLEKAMGEA